MTPGTTAHQAPLSMEFPRQEHWSGLPLLSPASLPNPGIKVTSLALAGKFFTTEPPHILHIYTKFCAQSSPTLCNPMDSSLPVSSVHGILQARILGRVAIPFSRSSQPTDQAQISHCRQILYHLSHQGSPTGGTISLKIE